MRNKQMTLNGTSYDYRGIGYTRAFIAVDRMRDNRFIGYIPTKDEWIIAIKGIDGSYSNSKYFLDEFQGDYETEIILQSEGA